MKIRPALVNDLDAIYKIEQENFTPEDFGLSKASIRYHLKKNILYVIEEKQKLAGYILWLRRKKYYRLYSLAISAALHSNGYGTKLMEYSISQLQDKELHLEVKTTNTNAIKLYEKFLFQKRKILRNYYPQNIDGILMIRNLRI